MYSQPGTSRMKPCCVERKPCCSSDTGLNSSRKKSRIARFDWSVNEELRRRRDPHNVLVEATSSDASLLTAVDNLTKAEAKTVFHGAVRAAEKATAALDPNVDSITLEQAAAIAAETATRSFEAELVDVIKEDIPGVKPIQVIGYMGVTRPKNPLK